MTSPTSLPSFGSPVPPSRLEQVQQVLTALEVNPVLDDDGDLQITVNDAQLYVRVSDDGPGLLRVFGQWQIAPDMPADLSLRHGAAAHVTASHALVKVNIFEEALVVATDQIVPEPTRYDVVVPASIDAVLSAVGMWHQIVVENGQAAAEGSEGAADGDTPAE